ncbi:MAG: phage terminase large subunit [Geminicoccaceae bacterium]
MPFCERSSIRRRSTATSPHPPPRVASKEERAKAMAGQAKPGNVILVRGSWNDEFIDEATAFPMGEHDDQIDAASRAYHLVADYGPRAGVW